MTDGPCVAIAIRLRQAGLPWAHIADRLNAAGYRAPRGGPWLHWGVARAVRRELGANTPPVRHRQRRAETAPAVAARIVELHHQQLPWSRIAASLNEDGYPCARGGRWQSTTVGRVVRACLGADVIPPGHPRRRREAARGALEARRAATSARRSRGTPWPDVAATAELPADVDAWLECAAAERPRTRLGRLHSARLFVGFVGRGYPCAPRLTREQLRQFQLALALHQPHPSTRSRTLVDVRDFLRFAFDEGWTERDLSRHIALPKRPDWNPKPVPPELVGPMLRALPRRSLLELRDRALVHFLVSTGCRITEALAFDVSQLRPDGVRVCGFKTGRWRTVYLTEDSQRAVTEYLDARGSDASPALFVCTNAPRQRLGYPGARAVFARLQLVLPDEPGMQRLHRPHIARHTAATVLLEVTQDVRLVQEVLGHRNLSTLHVYTELTDRRKRAVYEGPFARLLHGRSVEPAPKAEVI